MSSHSIGDLIPALQPYCKALIDLASQYGVNVQITSTLRSYSDQTTLYNNYLSGRAKYPAALPGTSAHEFGFAFDAVVPNASDQQALGQIWRAAGGVWGGEEDVVHFQYPGFSPPAPPAQGQPSIGQQGNIFYQLADLLVYFLPGVGQIVGKAQLAVALYQVLGGSADLATWYVQHPAEAIRDLQNWFRSWLPPWLQGVLAIYGI